MQKVFKRLVNHETIVYFIFGVLTTLVDWLSYACLERAGANYLLSTALSWSAAVLFAFITNKFFVFCNYDLKWSHLFREFTAFVSSRGMTGLLTLLGMRVLVGVLSWNEYISKAIISVVSLVLNYILSKLFVFKKSEYSGRSE